MPISFLPSYIFRLWRYWALRVQTAEFVPLLRPYIIYMLPEKNNKWSILIHQSEQNAHNSTDSYDPNGVVVAWT